MVTWNPGRMKSINKLMRRDSNRFESAPIHFNFLIFQDRLTTMDKFTLAYCVRCRNSKRIQEYANALNVVYFSGILQQLKVYWKRRMDHNVAGYFLHNGNIIFMNWDLYELHGMTIENLRSDLVVSNCYSESWLMGSRIYQNLHRFVPIIRGFPIYEAN